MIDFFGQPVEVGAVVATTFAERLVFGVVTAMGPGGIAVRLTGLMPVDVSLLRESNQVVVTPVGNDVD